MESPCFSRPQSTASHLFARTRSFHRPTYKRPENNVSISANNMANDESNQRRKVKFLQILLLMDSFEAEDVLRSRERVVWTRSWIRRREERGAYHQLIRELAVEDTPAFARYFRMDKEKFNDLVGRISIHIQRQDTIMRAAISPGERLAVTSRYLATGEIF